MSTTEIEIKELAKIMTETISEKGGEIAMTTAQKIKKEGINEGINLGRMEGLKEGLKTTAKNLLNLGMTYNVIATATGLSIAEIENLKSEDK